jgi:hypothetical protein
VREEGGDRTALQLDEEHRRARRRAYLRARSAIGVERLHAAELGVGGLVEISEHLIAAQHRCRPVFDIYRVAKADYAAISVFDQVFD